MKKGTSWCQGLWRYPRPTYRLEFAVFRLVNDVMGGQAQTVELLPEMFNRTRNDISTRIHGTISNVNQAWTSHPTYELLPMVANAEPGSESAMTRFIMQVPPRYAPIVINRRLSPTQLWAELGGPIIENGDQDACAPVLNWIVLTATCPAASTTSIFLVSRPTHQLGSTPLINHRRELFYQLLPNMDQTRTVGDPSATRVAD
jgi:hypothetical protein